MQLNQILLVDDNEADNYYHARVIRKMNCAKSIVIQKNGQKALEYLKTPVAGDFPRPELIFLDINMPVMDGWEFLEAYQKLDAAQKGEVIVVMLTTSQNPDDQQKAEKIPEIAEFSTKPLSKALMEEILEKYFASKK